ncbi:unnamed protein product [Cladocopium goreaui]|uniref:LINE-1 retrotransposable element ORF2 protein (ORF2p) n=1 Tax=Cladocopium goreaui TaxID=2562237 RepID=A0A9P1DPL7_9DINO|nr:unnamed protein product [Cladocopium goreaui]
MVHCASSSTTTARANSTEAAYSGYTAVNSTGCLGLNGQRIGEANHPGPLEFLTIGTTNPGGLRNKEQLAVEQGSGIWSYSETHLSKVTQISAAKALKFHAANEGRHLRVHFGAPAALRARSSWAGTWTGVACTSDHSSKVLQVPWPDDFWASGRVLATQHFVGHHVITVVTIYGLPRGPTWPKAAELTNSLLEYITKEFVVGYQGIIIINGDFNYSPHELPCFDVWRAYGFCSAQDYANHRWHQPVAPTCKGATERDLLWMSPMAAALCQKVGVNDVFHDHSSVYVQLQVEVLPHVMRTWPRPREVPWQQVPIAEWHQHCESLDLPVPTDPTLAMKELAISFETSLTGYVPDLHEAKLSSAHCGRAQRLQPARQTTTPLTCRASRPGEAKLVDDKVGKAVILWFKQLRRIQSFRHASCAGHLHHEAVQYRIELWTAIKRAKGFNGSFSDWWLSQEFAMGLGPLPEQPPGAHQAVLIYQAFHHVFRSFEQWHLRQRQQVLQAKYDKTMKALFHDLRKPRPDQVDSFWDTRSYEVAAVKADTKGILFTQPVPSHEDGQWFFQGQSLAVHGSIEELLILDFLPEVAPGDHIDFHYHTVTTDQVHQSLMDFWQPRWNREELQQADTWSRMINFVKAYMPKIPLTLPTLTVEMWREALKRFKPQAARGADGWARLDLLNMSRPHTNQLLRLLTAIENRQMTWPDQLLEGLVIAIAKCDGAHRPNEFRPIVLLSIIYRCWASLRSRQMLQQLEPFIHADAHGFLPSREPAQTWMQIQAAVETSLQSELPMAGIGTDFVKAFNCIQRRPLWFLAEALGIPDGLLWPWKEFASRFTRRFMVCNQVSGPMRSTQGYAEGCPLSVLAMALIDWGYQVYQYQYAPQVRHLSFVDNISMLARQAHLVAWAFFTLRAFLTMWGLSLDLDKTYAWGTTAEIRLQLSQLGIRVVQDFSELGGALSFTAAHRVRFFVNRGANLQDKWQQLRRSRAPIAQKLHAVPMVFWAKALHGALSCTAAERHIHKLRTQAVRHLGLQLAGSNPMLRLSLACPHNAFDADVTIWTDSANTCRRVCQALHDPAEHWDGENSDLWTRMMTILAQTRNGQVEVRWTPSHIDDLLCENPTEEYLAVWNEIADQHAVNTNRNRGLAFTQLCQTAEEFYQLWRKRLQALRHFYLQVANTTKEEQEIIDLTDEPDVLVQKVFNETLGDTLPVNWQNQLSLNSESLAQPVEFVLTLFSKCIAEEPMQANFVAISFVELQQTWQSLVETSDAIEGRPVGFIQDILSDEHGAGRRPTTAGRCFGPARLINFLDQEHQSLFQVARVVRQLREAEFHCAEKEFLRLARHELSTPSTQSLIAACADVDVTRASGWLQVLRKNGRQISPKSFQLVVDALIKEVRMVEADDKGGLSRTGDMAELGKTG